MVVESKPDIRQYLIRVDGSNRVTHRNRCHLGPISEECSNPATNTYDNSPSTKEQTEGGIIKETIAEAGMPLPVAVLNEPITEPHTIVQEQHPTTLVENKLPIRKSGRIRKSVRRLDL